MKNFRFLLGLVCFVLSVSMPALAQDIVIDWEANKLTASPREVSQSTNAQLVIINVNDILYTYDVNLIATPRVPNDFALLRPTIPPAGALAAAAPTPCAALIAQANEHITALQTQLNALLNAPNQGNNKFLSIKLSETIKTWNEKVLPLISPLEDTINRLRAAACNAAEMPQQEAVVQKHLALAAIVAEIKSRVNSDHRIVRTVTLLPDNDYKVTVEEKYKKADGSSVVTEGGKREYAFSPISNVLTLSAGVLLTGLQQRSYLNRKDPTTDKNVLSIDGTGPARPIGVVLLNYQIPRTRFLKDQMGFNLASGLVIELGSMKSDVSRLGWFGGISMDIYRRLYITPGVHFGEFADFPLGFGPGSTIPANFGELNPVKRWTGRFAVAITYRTASFAKETDTGGSKK